MSKIFLAVAVCSGLCCAVSLFGQGPGGPGPRGPHGMMGGGPGPIGMGMGPGKVVMGAPYSADVTNSTSQTLADGNTINRVTNGHMARDAEGRTYFQQNISSGPLAQKGATTITFLSDPVAGYTYVLDPSTKVAMRRQHRSPGGEDRPGRAWSPERRPTGPGAESRVEADLGTQTIGGLAATGKSITRTTPAGAIGNAQPLVETSEIWTSPDLQVVVLSKRTDPRSGQSTYALSNIQRAEPNAALFQVPSEYTVQDAPVHGPR